MSRRIELGNEKIMRLLAGQGLLIVGAETSEGRYSKVLRSCELLERIQACLKDFRENPSAVRSQRLALDNEKMQSSLELSYRHRQPYNGRLQNGCEFILAIALKKQQGWHRSTFWISAAECETLETVLAGTD